jgi:hypothetical protein
VTTKELDRLLRTLRKHGVTSYPTPDGPIVLAGEPSEQGEPGRRRTKGPGAQANAEIGLGDLPELEEGDGDPRSFLQELARKNDPRTVAEAKAAAAAVEAKAGN